jgi:hypothetical protein
MLLGESVEEVHQEHYGLEVHPRLGSDVASVSARSQSLCAQSWIEAGVARAT